MALRAAGSILHAHVKRSRHAALIVSTITPAYHRVHTLDGDWHAALELFAAVEPNGHVPASAVLSDESGPAARALELTVVTSTLTTRLVDRLLQRTLAHHGAALVFVDPTTFADDTIPEAERGPTESAVQLLRLDRAGVPTLVLRRGDDLATKLAGGIAPDVKVAAGA